MKLLLILSLIILGSCGLATTRPKIEMSLAQAAFLAAKESGADIHASNLFRQAEDYYLKAKSSYRRKYFNKAKEYALLSKKFSEQAEYAAIRKKALEGNAE
jgi:stalled ribosome alternative rescue factor ArfA